MVFTGNEWTGGLLKVELVCESQNSCWLVADQIFVSCYYMKIYVYVSTLRCSFDKNDTTHSL